MVYALAADFLVVLHLTFIIYVVLGGILARTWPRSAYLHVPTALYGVGIEWVGWTCPLTPLETYFRRQAGQAGYDGGFIHHYVLPVIYPTGLTTNVQLLLGTLVILVNIVVYGLVLYSLRS